MEGELRTSLPQPGGPKAKNHLLAHQAEGERYAVRPSPLSFPPSANHSPPATKMRSKTVADLKKLKIRKKDDEAFSAKQPQKLLKKKKTHDVK